MGITIFSKSNLPCNTQEGRVPDSNMTGEYLKYYSLVVNPTRSNDGQKEFVSPTSNVSYATSASTDPNIYNKGNTGMMNLLLSLYGGDNGWIVQAEDINTLVANDVDLDERKAEKETYTATLVASSWTALSQTVSVSGVKSNDLIIVSPTASSFSAFNESNIQASAIGNGSITFTCTQVPTANLTANILDLGAVVGSTTGRIVNIVAPFNLPSQAANAGKFLATDGTAVSWQEALPVNSTTTMPTGTARKNYNGYFYATRVYGAVYNDYAEYRRADRAYAPGTVVEERGNGTLTLCKHKYSRLAHIVSDTFGMSVGRNDSEPTQVPVASAGRVLVKVQRNKRTAKGIRQHTYDYKVGDLLASSQTGRARKISRLQALLHPYAVLGVVSEIPSYPVWNGVEVNGRVWLELKK